MNRTRPSEFSLRANRTITAKPVVDAKCFSGKLRRNPKFLASELQRHLHLVGGCRSQGKMSSLFRVFFAYIKPPDFFVQRFFKSGFAGYEKSSARPALSLPKGRLALAITDREKARPRRLCDSRPRSIGDNFSIRNFRERRSFKNSDCHAQIRARYLCAACTITGSNDQFFRCFPQGTSDIHSFCTAARLFLLEAVFAIAHSVDIQARILRALPEHCGRASGS
jgi:hypothetical protein